MVVERTKEAMNNWISVKDRMPTESDKRYGEVMCIDNRENYLIGHLVVDRESYDEPLYVCTTNEIDLEGVTHWQSLPKPPTK